jgi:P27 family predicted phage terminase small subunit
MKPLRSPDGEKVRRLVLPPVAPKPPEGLSRRASAEWRRIVPELERAGVIAEIDRGVLTAYVTAWGYMMEAAALLKDGGVVRTRSGEQAKHPAWQVYREANRTLLAAAAQLYLTPTARLRIPVPHGATTDDGSGDDVFD